MRSTPRSAVRSLVLVAAVGGLLVGCSGDDGADTCDDIQDLRTEMVALSEVDVIDGGMDALRAQADEVKDSWEDLQASAGEQFDGEIAALESALAGLQDTVQGATDDGTRLRDVASDIRTGLEEVVDAWDGLTTAVTTELDDCEIEPLDAN